MDIHKLRIFTAIARTGSFSRAAESEFVTQPTVSQQVAQLESSLGVRLLDRGPRKVALTAAGEALLPYAEQILSLVETAAESAREAAGLADRTLRLGVGHTLATYVLPDLLRDYRARFPGRQVRITLGNTAELLESVAAGASELALVGTPASHPGVQLTPFLTDRVVAIFTPEQVPDTARIAPDSLSNSTLFIREPGSALYATIEQILGTAALRTENVIQLGETEAIKRCVAAGLGVALIQEMAVREEVASGKLAARQLEGIVDTRTYARAYRNGNPLSTAATDLIRLLTG